MLKEHLTATRCLNATRVLLDVMRSFNVRAEPLSVRAMAMNAIYMQKLDEIGRMPLESELNDWIAEGAWALGTDTRPESSDESKNQWAGHLVALVQDFLVDAAAVQMSRPAKGIEIPDVFVAPVTPGFLKGKKPIVSVSDEGAQLFYWSRLGDRSWEKLSGFQRHGMNVELAEEIAGEMAKMMGIGRRKRA